jgi:large subunit ribosomal protein L25
MSEYKINASVREQRKKAVQELREEGMIPAVVYGKSGNTAITLGASEFKKVYSDAGESSVIDLALEGKTVHVIVKEVQLHPISYEIIHADLYEVDMNKDIIAAVPIIFIGEAPAVKLGGVLITNLDEIEVKSKPGDLPHEITVDLSVLKELEASIYVTDLPIPANVTVETGADVLVVKVAEKKEEVEVEVSEADAIAAVQAEVGKPKEEESK